MAIPRIQVTPKEPGSSRQPLQQARGPVPQQAAAPKPEVERDPELTTIDLPSGFVPYTWKALSVKPLKGIHQAKFNAAARLQSTRALVEAISTLLPSDIRAEDLTTSDFRWLIYYLRVHNYATTPVQITAICRDPDHLQKVHDKELPEASLRNIGSLNASLIEETPLDIEALEENIKSEPCLVESGIELGFATMADTLKVLDLIENEKDSIRSEELQFIGEMAAFLKRTDANGQVIPLEERMKVVEGLSADVVRALDKYTHWAADYGVSEIVRMRCKECGAEIREVFRISAHMFL